MGIIGAPNAPIYCMTKGAVRNFTKALALGYAKENIRVNSMHPGDIETGLIDKNVLGQETIDTLSALIPLGRLGTSEEIAHGIIFMIENEYLTGAEILIDGGYVIQ